MELIRSPSELLFKAAKLGNFDFLAELINSYPDLIWEYDGENRSIIHFAVKHRHACIFNIIHEIGSIKDLIATYEDSQGNNILHLAAMLPPPHRLEIVSGAALQMQQELLWFEVYFSFSFFFFNDLQHFFNLYLLNRNKTEFFKLNWYIVKFHNY